MIRRYLLVIYAQKYVVKKMKVMFKDMYHCLFGTTEQS